ncbi:hydratase, partial [Blautia massiliensis (ex Durand et al. 2017)]
EKLQIKFDKLTSHDITFVGIIQTARASGLEKFPVPYVLTNCHNSLCAVGGTINEDDHMFGLTCAKKYGGVYVPPHQAVIHQFAREMLAGGGKMILGSDSHTRYGALGTMAMGEGGPELVKQLLCQTYDINMPGVVAIYLKGTPRPGVGPQDVALAIIGEVFANGYVKNKVMEFVGPGVANLSADFRIGIDVMTTETTCLSSIWQTDEKIEEFYAIHGRPEDYKELKPGSVAYYDGCVEIDLGEIKPMIAMPFHPSNTYTIDELKANLDDILADVEKRAQVSLDGKIPFTLRDKVVDGQLYVEQGIIAGCAGGGFENICAAADILKGKNIGHDAFTLSVYPASTPIYMELAKNGVLAELIGTGAVVKTAFCGPCFGAGDTPANNAFSIRHTTRNFPNREGSKIQNGQISSVALMDARSIAATAANKGFLTSAEEFEGSYSEHKYYFDKSIYENRVFDSKGVADPSVEIQFGPNIKDWPEMAALADNLILKVVSEIHDPVTTTDELIPSGETSSYRSNPLGLAEFTLSRKDPAYVGRAKEIQAAQKAIQAGQCPAEAVPELKPVMETIHKSYPDVDKTNLGVGSTIFAVK